MKKLKEKQIDYQQNNDSGTAVIEAFAQSSLLAGELSSIIKYRQFSNV